MDNSKIIKVTAEFMEGKLKGEGSGHDWWHIYRVWNLAKKIGKEEGADMLVVELAILLHDIEDSKFQDGDHTVGAKAARDWLESQGVEQSVVDKVTYIVEHMSFSASIKENKITSLEGQIVQDADRLDALGAIGIGRTFTYGGKKGNVIYDPDMPYRENLTPEQYAKDGGKGVPTINHFYEKLFKLKDMMNTDTGRKLAEERHRYMQDYVERFMKEWEGEL